MRVLGMLTITLVLALSGVLGLEVVTQDQAPLSTPKPSTALHGPLGGGR